MTIKKARPSNSLVPDPELHRAIGFEVVTVDEAAFRLVWWEPRVLGYVQAHDILSLPEELPSTIWKWPELCSKAAAQRTFDNQLKARAENEFTVAGIQNLHTIQETSTAFIGANRNRRTGMAWSAWEITCPC